MHVGGGFFPSDTPKYNSTYGVLLMKQEDKPLPVQPKDTIVTVVSCSDATGYVGVGLNNPLAKLHVYSESIIDTTTDYS